MKIIGLDLFYVFYMLNLDDKLLCLFLLFFVEFL